MSDEDSHGCQPDATHPLLPRRVAILRAGEMRPNDKKDRHKGRDFHPSPLVHDIDGETDGLEIKPKDFRPSPLVHDIDGETDGLEIKPKELTSKYTILPSIVTEKNFEQVERLVTYEFGEEPERISDEPADYERLYNKMNSQWELMMRCRNEADDIITQASQQLNRLQNHYRKYRRQTCAIPSRIPLPKYKLVVKRKEILKPIALTKYHKKIAHQTQDSPCPKKTHNSSQFSGYRQFQTVRGNFEQTPSNLSTDTARQEAAKPFKAFQLFDSTRKYS